MDAPSTRLALGVDLGGTNARVALVSGAGEVLRQDDTATAGLATPADLADWLARRLDAWPERPDDLSGVGLGVPNGHHGRGTIEHPPNLPWPGVSPLAALVTERTGLPAVLDNDANVAALGEALFGAGRGEDHFALVTLGTGIGGGIVIDGRVLRGADGFAAEVGHLLVQPGGRTCGCGRAGCAEKYASVTGLLITVREGLAAGAPGHEAFGDGSCLDDPRTAGALVGRLAGEGNPLALAAYDLAAEMLARALADLCSVTAPGRIVVAGGLTQAGDLFLGPLATKLEACLLPCHRGRVALLPSSLPAGHAALLGAAGLVLGEAP